MLNSFQLLARVASQLSLLVRFALVFIVLWASTVDRVDAQPSVGAIFKDHLALGGGASTPLPPGQWQLTKTVTIPRMPHFISVNVKFNKIIL